VAQLVEALRYKPEGRGFDSRCDWHNPFGRTVALGSTQPLTEMSTRDTSWGVKAAGAYGWQPYHLQLPIVWKSGSLTLLEPSGPVQACTGIALPLPFNAQQGVPQGQLWPWTLYMRKDISHPEAEGLTACALCTGILRRCPTSMTLHIQNGCARRFGRFRCLHANWSSFNLQIRKPVQ
jgi:hypothetical protein